MRITRMFGARSTAAPVLVLAGLAFASIPPARAIEFCKPGKNASYRLAAGDTHTGDIYTWGQTIDIAGTQHGDLIGWGQAISISGDLDGDLMVGGQSVTVLGRVGDSARIFADSLVIQGTIEGDVLAFGKSVTVGPNAVITGDLAVMGQNLTIAGRVDGTLKGSGQSFTLAGSVGSVDVTVGEFFLRGAVERDAKITCDTLEVEPESRVGGDLTYTSRQPVEGLDESIAGGKVEFVERVDEEDDDSGGGLSWSSVLWMLFWMGCSWVMGTVLIASFRKLSPAIEKAIAAETFPCLGVGFVLAIVLPVAALILCFLVVTIPLAGATLLLWAIGVYIAKVPVAIWIGRRALRAAGSSDPSPYLGLVVGLIALYVVFEIPFLVGFLAWWATVFLGFGAISLGVRASLQTASPSSG